MSKVTTKENYRVVIEPITHIYGIKLSDDTVQRDLKTILEQVKRHVDNVHDCSIDFDTFHTCSHCHLEWEVSEDNSDPDFPKGTPVCCQPAIDEYKQSQQIENQ